MIEIAKGDLLSASAEAAQMDAVRALLPRFEAKIQRVLDRVWGGRVEQVALKNQTEPNP